MGGLGTFALGVTAALAARAFAPRLGRWARPAARGVVKQGIILAHGAQVRSAGLREDLEDLMAEARAELREQAQAQGGAQAGAGG
ncbi:MAG: DUF5132 domain-containing protein, partial [Chloroflexota bacterium]